MKSAGKLVTAFIGVCLIAFSITICVLVGQQLSVSLTLYFPDGTIYWTGSKCLMTTNSINICAYSWAASAIGIIAGIAMIGFGLASSKLAAGVVSIFSTIWYLALAVTVNAYSHKCNNFQVEVAGGVMVPMPYPRNNYRVDVYALAYTCFVCSLIALVASASLKSEEEAQYEQEHGDGPKGAVSAVDPEVGAKPAAA